MIVLGVDPGFKATGYGFIEIKSKQPKLLETGTIEPKARKRVEEKLDKVYSVLSDLVDQYKPDVMVLEKIYSHYKHPATVAVMGHMRGVICLVCAKKKILLSEQSVKRIRKALTGNGGASKLQTRSCVAHRLKIDEQKLTLDASDALALALGYASINGCSL